MASIIKLAKRSLRSVLPLVPKNHVFPRMLHQKFWSSHLQILMYHLVVPDNCSINDWSVLTRSKFISQMRYLKNWTDVLPLSDAVTRCRKGQLTRPTVAITFDDGYQHTFSTAFPILEELQLPATVFLSSGLIGSERTIWYFHLLSTLQASSQRMISWYGRRYHLSTADEKASALRHWIQKLKSMPHHCLLQELTNLLQILGGSFDQLLPDDSPFLMLNVKSIAAMTASGLIEFGGHTRDHTILSRLTPQQQEYQIAESIRSIETITGKPCLTFAYPNGRRQDYNQTTIDIVSNYGIEQAVTTIKGCNRPTTSALELRRIGVGGSWNMDLFRIVLHSPF